MGFIAIEIQQLVRLLLNRMRNLKDLLVKV